VSIADDCRTLLEALPGILRDPAAHHPREAAARLWTDLRKFPPEVDQAALAAGVDIWPAVERLANAVTDPRSWATRPEAIAADLRAIIAACDGAPIPVQGTEAPEATAAPHRPLLVTAGPAANPAALARAIPGQHLGAGIVYGQAGAWLESLDPALAERLQAIGSTLRALQRDRASGQLVQRSKPSAGEVYRAAVGGKKGVVRAEQARFFNNGAQLIEAGAESLPAGLVAWLVPRLRAVAEAIGNMADAKPAGAVLRALGAAREGQQGRHAGDDLQDERDALLVWEVVDRMKRHPELKQWQIFPLVASEGPFAVSESVVRAAWKRRRLFLN
jgi:hypothetical protein